MATLITTLMIMSMPKPMPTQISTNIVDKMVVGATDVANELRVTLKGMRVPSSAPAQNIDVGVSVDGTWQRRGFSSNNGVVTAISIDTSPSNVLNKANAMLMCER